MNNSNTNSECPICCKSFPSDAIEVHVNRCIFLNTTTISNGDNSSIKEPKRSFSVFQSNSPTGIKKPKLDENVKKKSATVSGKRLLTNVDKIQTIEIDDNISDDQTAVSTNPFTNNIVGLNSRLNYDNTAFIEVIWRQDESAFKIHRRYKQFHTVGWENAPRHDWRLRWSGSHYREKYHSPSSIGQEWSAQYDFVGSARMRKGFNFKRRKRVFKLC